MKTYAVGRFLIDLPATATDVSMSQRVFGTDIEWKPATAAQFRGAIETRISRLKGANPATQRFISDEEGPLPNTRIVMFEEDDTLDGFIGYEAYRYAEEIGGYFLLSGSAARRRVATVKPSIADILKFLRPQLIDASISDRGSCFDHAVIKGGDPQWGETVAITASFDDVAIMLSTQVVGRVDDGPTLLQRAERIGEFAGAKLLRKSVRSIAGLNGAEFAFIDTPQANSAFSFQWEYKGQQNSIASPKISAAINTRGPILMSEAELLGLSDTILDSIRLRPGAI